MNSFGPTCTLTKMHTSHDAPTRGSPGPTPDLPSRVRWVYEGAVDWPRGRQISKHGQDNDA